MPGRAAQPVFPKAVAAVFAGADGGTAIGSVTPGTPLMPVAGFASGAARGQVRLDGWSEQGGEAVVYPAPDQRVILARLTPQAMALRKVLGTKTDSFGTTWQHVEVSAWIAAADVVPDVSAVWDEAAQLYAAHCSSCHALHGPSEFTANAWPGVMRAMTANAGLTPDQTTLITRYLQANAHAP